MGDREKADIKFCKIIVILILSLVIFFIFEHVLVEVLEKASEAL